jgi:hypothetical protein
METREPARWNIETERISLMIGINGRAENEDF